MVIAAMKLKDSCFEFKRCYGKQYGGYSKNKWQNSHQFSSVTQSCVNLCDPMQFHIWGHILLKELKVSVRLKEKRQREFYLKRIEQSGSQQHSR